MVKERRRKEKLSAEATAVGRAKLLELMTEAKLDRYPFVEPETGKRRNPRLPGHAKGEGGEGAAREEGAKGERGCDEVQREDRAARLDGGRRRPATSVAPAAHSPMP